MDRENLKKKIKENMPRYKKAAYYTVMAAAFLSMLYFLSGKLRLFFLALGLLSFGAAWLLRGSKKGLAAVGAALLLLMACGNVFYNRLRLSDILPFYRSSTQTFYNTGFLENGLYPDSFLRLLLKDKTVYVKDDVYALDDPLLLPEYENHEKDKGRSYLYVYYHGRNTENFLRSYAKDVFRRDSLNDKEVTEEQLTEQFIDLGAGNDMLRYTFLFNDFPGESSNYFVYYWYYYTYLPKALHIYLNPEGMLEEDRLVVLWEHDEVENLYIMGYDYYKREVAGQ